MKKDSKKRLMIAAGGTGGHVFPAQALANYLCDQGWDITVIQEKRGSRWTGFDKRVRVLTILTGHFGRGGLFKKLMNMALLPVGCVQSLVYLYRFRPQGVIGFGGYPSFPVLAASLFYPTKRFVHEQNAILGRVNRWLFPFLDHVAVSIPLVEPRVKTTLTGLPVRPQILEGRKHPYPPLKEPFTIAVLGGSQGAKIFSDVLPVVFKALKEQGGPRIKLIQQCRKENLEETQQVYEKEGIEVELTPFIEDISEVLVKSHLIISRAGASSLAEVTTVGRPCILVPYALAMDDHQSANAAYVQKAGAGWVLTERSLKGGEMLPLLKDLLAQPRRLTEAANRAKDIGPVQATQTLGRLIKTQLEG